MDYFGQDHRFWLTVIIASAIKVFFSETFSFVRAVSTVMAAIFAAWAFTPAFLDWSELNPETYEIPIAALFALTGEGLMRWVINLTPDKALMFWKGVNK